MRLHDVATATRDILPGIWATDEDLPYYYIAGVINVSEDIDETECEELDPNDDATPDFWSLYFVQDFADTTVITDFPTREHALEYARNTCLAYDAPVYDWTAEGYYG